jgi:transcriptional regulator with XRE-family HTH domain
MSKIATALRREIAASGLSKAEIAAGVGVNRSTIHRFIAGKSISLELAESLAKFLDVRIEVARGPHKKK